MEMPEKLKQRRDELLHKMKRQESNYEERAHAKEGFNAAWEELAPVVEALEIIAEPGSNLGTLSQANVARQALKKLEGE